MAWVIFVLSAAMIVYAAVQLAEAGDVIAVRTGMSGMFIGALLLAGATSLPELLAAFNALKLDVPNMAAGGMFGSGMFNMFMLGMLDLLNQKTRILRRIATSHALTASLAGLLTALAVFFVLADVEITIGWVGLDSLLIMLAYIGGVRLIQGNGGQASTPPSAEELDKAKVPGLWSAGLRFSGATLALVLVTPWMVRSANEIALLTGLSAGFIGATLLAIVTSLPELVTTVAAVRFGSYDLAVGNLFGSNIFNMFALGLTDVLFTQGRFLGVIDPTFAIAGLLVLILTSMGLIGNLARVERRLWFVEVDAALILLSYFAGMWLLYARGIGV